MELVALPYDHIANPILAGISRYAIEEAIADFAHVGYSLTRTKQGDKIATMTELNLTIRDAGEADIVQIAPFFRAIVSAGETYAYPENLDDQAIAELWLERPPGRTIVAVNGEGAILGSAKFGPNRPARGSHIATASFMVDPASQGRGLGRALGEAVLNLARAQGFHGMQFNAVVETNTSAVHLWQSLGFTIMTTIPEAFDHPRFGLVGLHVMYLKF